jgi:hypothetical protein
MKTKAVFSVTFHVQHQQHNCFMFHFCNKEREIFFIFLFQAHERLENWVPFFFGISSFHQPSTDIQIASANSSNSWFTFCVSIESIFRIFYFIFFYSHVCWPISFDVKWICCRYTRWKLYKSGTKRDFVLFTGPQLLIIDFLYNISQFIFTLAG